MKEKNILMIVHTMGNLEVTDNDRFTYIAKKLVEKGHHVEIVTSDFEHHKKRYRDENIIKQHPFDITFLHENYYKKNISIQRVLGHISFAERLKKYLKERIKPDVVYCAIPPTVSASVTSSYCRKNNIKLVIDIQDLWPESFSIALGNSVLSRVILKPMEIIVNSVYRQANSTVAVSETYLKRAEKVNLRSKEKYVVYLGTDSQLIDNYEEFPEVNKKKDEFWVGYIGNLGNSYDFKNVFIALSKLKQEGITNIKFIIVGDGDKRGKIERLAKDYYQNTIITGYLPYKEMFSYLKKFDVAVNPIIAGTASSIVNKVGDYAAAGIPVVNTQDNQEYRNLLEMYEAGINTIPEDSDDIARKIKNLYGNDKLRKKMGENNRKLFEEKFDRNKSYEKILVCIEGEKL